MAIEVTAGAVVYRHGQAGIEYLLLQSMNKGNFWGFPKGHVEAGESLVETARQRLTYDNLKDLLDQVNAHLEEA